MEEKINLSLFEEFFESSSPANYAKMLINTKNADENKEIVEEIENRISDLKDRIEQMSDKEKKYKNANETKIIRKILDYNKNTQNFFHQASKVDKRKSKPKFKKSIAERMKLRRQKFNIVKKKKENINNELFSHYFEYLNPVIMFEKFRDSSDEKNKSMVESSNEKPTKLKNIVKMCLKMKYLNLKRMKK